MLKQNKQHYFYLLLVAIALAMLSLKSYAEQSDSPYTQSKSNTWAEAGIKHLIARIGWAAQQEDFSGRYIISQSDAFATLKTTHIGTNDSDYELVIALAGDENQMFRQGEHLYTINPHLKNILLDRQSLAQLFPDWGKPEYGHAQNYYQLELLRSERFIGRNTDVIRVIPQDSWRFGYKIWLDQATGLLLRLEIEDPITGGTLQRMSFTDINVASPAESEKLQLQTYIDSLKKQDYTVQDWPFVFVAPQEHGWQLTNSPHGFETVISIMRPLDEHTHVLQWVLSDGVATISIFIEPQTNNHNFSAETWISSGATNLVAYSLNEWRITLVGEVPAQTLHTLAAMLQRKQTSH